jgi:hypothetical protein
MCHTTGALGMVCLGTSDAPASSVRETSADSFQQLTTQPTQSSQQHRSLFRNPAPACQKPVRCYAARAGASFRPSAAQHSHGPSVMLGPLSLVEGFGEAGCPLGASPNLFFGALSSSTTARSRRIEAISAMKRVNGSYQPRNITPMQCSGARERAASCVVYLA